MKKISSTALGKKLNLNSKEITELLESNGYIIFSEKGFFNKEINKELTRKGEKLGGEYIKNSRFGTYIVWPSDFIPDGYNNINLKNLVTVSKIAEKFGISAKKVNQIISELGWIEKNLKGWKLTNFGKSLGGSEHIIQQTGATFTKWPEDIVNNKSLISSIGGKNNIEDSNNSINISTNEDDFRHKFPAQYRTKDGHNVRSRGELLIDNALYEYGLVHAYERKLPIEEDLYSDFYIPPQNGGQGVYIEYWGIENKKKYENRKEIKKDIYKKYHLNLIELENNHIDNLDDFLPRLLLNYGINVD